MWGQAYKAVGDGKPFGIIPTRVGTRFRDDAMKQLAEDHPHACGDKFEYVYTTVYTIGSSPRVWGQAEYI